MPNEIYNTTWWGESCSSGFGSSYCNHNNNEKL